jgi:hypothetical protein
MLGRRASPFPIFLFPSPLHAREMERREAPGCLRGTPGEPCEGSPRAVAIRRAHPSDVGVRRLPALHLRRCGQGHVLPAPTAPLRYGRFNGATSANHLFMICSIGIMSRRSRSIDRENVVRSGEIGSVQAESRLLLRQITLSYSKL